jgi:DNA repair protein SbcD/Mre11
MIRFIHTADVHFGMENYGRIDTTSGIHSRLLDFHKAFNICIDYAIKENVDFFLFAGDAYKTAHPSPTQQRLFIDCLLRLFAAKIPIVMVLGNHDHPLSFGKVHALDLFSQLPVEGFHVLAKPTTLMLQTKSGPVQIVGIPWPSKNMLALNSQKDEQQDISEQISRGVLKVLDHYVAQLNPNLPTVLAAHLTISNAIFSGSEKRALTGRDPLFMPSQLARPPFDYVALGHLHRYQNLNPHGHPAVVYSGSIERIDFGERNEDKGFCAVTIHNKENTTHEFIKIPTRPFIHIEVRLQEQRGQTDQIIDAIKKHDIRGAIVKIIYHLPPGSQDKVDTRALHNVCEEALHLIGIFPVYTRPERELRAGIQPDMDLETMLKTYFITKQLPTQRITQLIEKTLLLTTDIHQLS